MTEPEYAIQLACYIEQVENALKKYAQVTLQKGSMVSEAAAYSLFCGGKRIRGCLVLAFCALCGGDMEIAMAFAAAVEMIHTYSLIHDDLPCMDDDDMRRGKPACHIAYGEANALLAGDALLTAAFAVIAVCPANAEQKVKALSILSEAAGAKGMVYGQEMDLYFENHPATEKELESIHAKKTGALIKASCLLGCAAGNVKQNTLTAVKEYADDIGLVFQIADDVLDATTTSEVLGKPAGSDFANGKTTYVTIFGVEKAKILAETLTQKAIAAISTATGDIGFLTNFAAALLLRNK